MRKILLAVLLLSGWAVASDWSIAIRVRGTVEVSPDGQAWTGLIRNRKLTDHGFARTLADSLGQVRSGDGALYILAPQTTVQLQSKDLSLQTGALRLEGLVKLQTRLGTLVSQDPTFEGCLMDRGSQGMLCEVFEGWIHIQRPDSPAFDVDGGERAVWDAKAVTVSDGTPGDLPADLRPRLED